MTYPNGIPSGYIKSDAMALDIGSWYRFNFVYKGVDGLRYSIHDATNDIPIIPWTSNGTHFGQQGAENAPFKYPFEAETIYGNTTDYIYFYVPNIITSSSATTKNIELRLAPNAGDSKVYISGLTIRKSYNDLVTMSKNVGGAHNPFIGATNSFSRYETKFKIPKAYNDASDWILKLHAGAWDYHNNATFAPYSQSQEIYFKR